MTTATLVVDGVEHPVEQLSYSEHRPEPPRVLRPGPVEFRATLDLPGDEAATFLRYIADATWQRLLAEGTERFDAQTSEHHGWTDLRLNESGRYAYADERTREWLRLPRGRALPELLRWDPTAVDVAAVVPVGGFTVRATRVSS